MKSFRSLSGSAWAFFPTRLVAGLCLAGILHDVAAHNFVRVGDANGLDAQVVSSLLVDRQGYLWVGSREGLYRYDGYQALSFTSDASDPATLSDTDIRFIYESGDGILWISTNTGGLNRYDRSTGRFERFQHDAADPTSINDNNVYSMAEDSEGHLWISTEKGVARMLTRDGAFERFTHHDPLDRSSISSDRAYALYASPAGDLWIATVGGGINRWDSGSESFERFDLAGMAAGPSGLNDVFAVRDAGDGRLWAGTRSGLVLASPGAGSAQRIETGACPDDLCPVPAIDLDDEGRLWVGTMDHGVYRIDADNLLVEPLVEARPGEPGALPARPLLSLEVHEQNIFVGTWGAGLFRAQVHALPYKLIDGEITGGILPNETVTAIHATNEAGKPWIGSFGGGVQQVDVVKNRMIQAVDDGDPIFHAGVLDLALSPDGSHHAATSQGLSTFSSQAETLEFEQHDPAREGSVGAGYLHAVLQQENGDLWVGSGGDGLYRRKAGQDNFMPFRNDPSAPGSLSGDFITTLLDDGENSLWIGTRSNGLNRCQIEPWQCERFDGRTPGPLNLGHFHVTDLYRSRNGRLWVATNGGGLHEVKFGDRDQVSGFQRWSSDDGLLADGIMAIAEDADESLWLSTRVGLSRLDPDTGRFVNHVEASGLPVSHFNSGAAGSDSQYLYFGSTGGLLAIEKGTVLEPRQPSPVTPTLVQTAEEGEQLASRPWDGSPLTLSYGQLLSLEFAVLDFTESSHEYAYRFHEDEAWTQLGNRRVVTFFGLAPGTYHIQARGRDAFGLWGQSEALHLRVKPPFWMQPWFRLAVVALLILAALAIHQVRLARERRIAREVRRLSEKRESALEAALGNEAELAVLTPRQKEVFQLLAEGYSAREISELLDVSIKTVQAHRANLMERLELGDLSSLVRLAIRTGIISPEDH